MVPCIQKEKAVVVNRITQVILVGAVALHGSFVFASSTLEMKTLFYLNSMETALKSFYLDFGEYPSTEDGLLYLVKNVGASACWNGPYVSNIRDAWGNLLVYVSSDGNKSFSLYSKGQNGVDDKGMLDDLFAKDLEKFTE